jgi:hypothetical protein
MNKKFQVILEERRILLQPKLKLSKTFIIISAAQALLRLSKLRFRVTHRKKEDPVTATFEALKQLHHHIPSLFNITKNIIGEKKHPSLKSII